MCVYVCIYIYEWHTHTFLLSFLHSKSIEVPRGETHLQFGQQSLDSDDVTILDWTNGLNSSMDVDKSECREVVGDMEKCKKTLLYVVELFNRVRIYHILRTQNLKITAQTDAQQKIVKAMSSVNQYINSLFLYQMYVLYKVFNQSRLISLKTKHT